MQAADYCLKVFPNVELNNTQVGVTAAVFSMRNGEDIPSNYYCGWNYELNPRGYYILMI